jgi:hypothetical protein
MVLLDKCPLQKQQLEDLQGKLMIFDCVVLYIVSLMRLVVDVAMDESYDLQQ